MNEIYPQIYTAEDLRAVYAMGRSDGREELGSEEFSRGVLTTFWFFYRLLNGGKPKSPSGEAQA